MKLKNRTLKRVGIDCRMINESGIGRYIYNIINEISKKESLSENIEFYLFFFNLEDSFKLNLPKNFKIIHAPFLWHSFSEQTFFLQVLNTYNLDLFHSPHPNMPYLYSKKFIITLHDLTMLQHKTGRASTYSYPIYFLKWFVFKLSLFYAVSKAYKVITVSNYVKDQIVKTFKISTDKVEVIYNGVSDTIYKENENSTIKKVLEKFNIDKKFLFYVGNAYPHKNIENLILAFELFNKNKEYNLVLAGKEDFFYKRLKNEYSKVQNIKFLGICTDAELRSLYSSCESFIYPSISEGFGIQIVEALKCGSKIACSKNTVFPEIAERYAIYFDPFSVTDIKEKITKVLSISKNDFFEGYNEKFLEKYSWKISAQKHLEIYEQN
jgi:glycosyltransferase involved in cell wall biosynthesis